MHKYEEIFFISSAGHCNLDCPYCIINPISKNQTSLKQEELSFLLKRNNKKKLFIFSGLGDFFASYRKDEKLLSFLVEQGVDISLDINGVLIQEYPQLSHKERQKIIYINLTMHFNQLKQKRLLDSWLENTKKIIINPPQKLFLNTIFSPLLVEEWEESLQFYSKNIFDTFKIKLVIVKDVVNSFNRNVKKKLCDLQEKYSYLISEVIDQDFTIPLAKGEYINCPAGQKYFRISNNGFVQGCLNNNSLSNMGNVFDKTIFSNNHPIHCVRPNFCDCNTIKDFGMLDVSFNSVQNSFLNKLIKIKETIYNFRYNKHLVI